MITLFARIVEPGLLGLTKRDLQDCGRTGMHAAGLYWHQNYKWFHFQTFAYAKYGYSRRSKKYQARKLREHPQSQGRPLVWSGGSERSAMAGQRVNAKATSWDRYRAEVVINAPTLNYQRLRTELTRVTAGEQRRLAEVFRDGFEKRMVSLANQKVVPLEMTQRVA